MTQLMCDTFERMIDRTSAESPDQDQKKMGNGWMYQGGKTADQRESPGDGAWQAVLPLLFYRLCDSMLAFGRLVVPVLVPLVAFAL